MAEALANPKLFGAACLLFAAATLVNASANASSASGRMCLKADISQSKGMLKVGPYDTAEPLGRR
jgi:hypothetical protein